MKAKRIRNICILMVGVLCGITLTCGYSVAQQKKEITIWGWDERSTKTIAEPVAEFEKLHPDVMVKPINFGYVEMQDRILTSLATGIDLPDVYFMTTGNLIRDIRTGGLVEVTDVVRPYVNKFPASYLKMVQYEGKIYGFPFDAGPGVFFYRKDIFDKFGVQVPRNWTEDIAEAGRKICKDFDGDGKQDYFLGLASVYVNSWVRGRGGKVTNEKGDVLFNNPITVEVMKWIKEITQKDKALRYTPAYYSPEGFELFKQGIVVAQPAGYFFSGYGLQKYAYNAEAKWRVAQWMPWKPGDPPTGVDVSPCSSWVITKGSKDVEECEELLKIIGLREDFIVSLGIGSGIVHIYLPALEKLATMPIDFFGGQKVYSILNAEMRVIPEHALGPNWSVIGGALDRAMDRVILEDMSIEDSLRKAEEETRKEIE